MYDVTGRAVPCCAALVVSVVITARGNSTGSPWSSFPKRLCLALPCASRGHEASAAPQEKNEHAYDALLAESASIRDYT